MFGQDVKVTVHDDGHVVYHDIMKKLLPKWPDVVDSEAEAKRWKMEGKKVKKKS